MKLCYQSLDDDHSGSVTFPEFKRACHKLKWGGDVKMLFDCLEIDAHSKIGGEDAATGKRALTLNELDARGAEWGGSRVRPCSYSGNAQVEPLVQHYFSNACVLQQWRITRQSMMILDTTTNTKQTRLHWTSSVRQVVPPKTPPLIIVTVVKLTVSSIVT